MVIFPAGPVPVATGVRSSQQLPRAVSGGRGSRAFKPSRGRPIRAREADDVTVERGGLGVNVFGAKPDQEEGTWILSLSVRIRLSPPLSASLLTSYICLLLIFSLKQTPAAIVAAEVVGVTLVK